MARGIQRMQNLMNRVAHKTKMQAVALKTGTTTGYLCKARKKSDSQCTVATFSQISKMTSELEQQVNEAIEFFPGRVKRDEWANQAKALLEGAIEGDA